MNVLFVTSYPLEYNSSANIRNWGLIEGLLENGHEISTLSPYPSDRELFAGKVLSCPFKKRYWVGAIVTSEDRSVANHSSSSFKLKANSIAFKIFNFFCMGKID